MNPGEENLAAYVHKLAMKISRLRVKYYTKHVLVDGIWIDRPVPEKVHVQQDKMFSYWVEMSAKLDAIRNRTHRLGGVN